MHLRHWGIALLALALAAQAGAGTLLDRAEPKAVDPKAPLVSLDESGAPVARGPDVPGVGSSPYADKDRNRVFDSLDREMFGKPDHWSRDVIVLLDELPTEAKMAELKGDLGGFVVNSNKESVTDAEGKPWEVIPAFAAELTKAQILRLAQRADVQQVEPVVEFYVQMNTARDESGVNKAQTDFGVTGDRDGDPTSYTAADVVICVVDTGIYNGHVDLDGGKVIGWKDYVGTSSTPYDDNGHGTHVSATAAGTGEGNSIYRGVAQGAALVGTKVLNAAGSGSSTAIVNGINFCNNNKATYGIEIITISIGGGTCTSGTDSMSAAVNNAWNNGLVVTIAGGNSGPGYCTIGDPGAAANPITVGAVSDPDNVGCSGYPSGGWYLAAFSSRGLTGDGRFKPDIGAPGVCITSAWRTSPTAYATLSGTSMATPFTAGGAALMLDACPTCTPATIKSQIMATSRDAGPNNQQAEPQSYDWGAGMLDVHTAVEVVCGCGTYNAPGNPAHFPRTEDLAATGRSDYWNLAVGSTVRRIAMTLIIPSAGPTKDYDIYLYNPSGTQVASGLGTTRQETVTYAPTVTGTYQVRVYSYTGSGVYWLDVGASASSFALASDG